MPRLGASFCASGRELSNRMFGCTTPPRRKFAFVPIAARKARLAGIPNPFRPESGAQWIQSYDPKREKMGGENTPLLGHVDSFSQRHRIVKIVVRTCTAA